MITLQTDETDATEFVDHVAAVIRGAAFHYACRDLYIIKINNWFGRRWLGFSHKFLGGAGVHSRRDFVIPPFTPARVVSTSLFRQSAGSDEYLPAEIERPIHIDQMASMNWSRRVRKELPGAVLFWWSAGSRLNRKGSLMCYYPGSDGYEGWYAGFAETETWRISETAGITPELLQGFRPVETRAL